MKTYIMSICIKLSNPNDLLRKLKRAVDIHIIDDWEYLNGMFSPLCRKLHGKAFMRAEIGRGELLIGIVPVEGIELTPDLYAAYHSKFIETLLLNFEKDIKEISTSCRRKYPDAVNSFKITRENE